jgi:hypothetical protein
VTEFLSPAWVAELDAALRALETVTPTAPRSRPVAAGDPARGFVVEQRVRRDDGVVHVHHLVAADGRFRAVAGPAPDPDLILTTDLDTAIALQRGVITAQLALATGHLRLGGDLDHLRTHADLFVALDDVFVTLRAGTTAPATTSAAPRTDPVGGSPEGPR